MPQPRASGYFRTDYADDWRLLQTRGQRGAALAGVMLACMFLLDLANQVLIAVVGAVALMLLTGYAGQVSLGHAGLMAAGAFTTGILARETGAPFWMALPASGVAGALIGFLFGLPSLRLRGLYLAVSTLALHFIVIHAGQEYETRRGLSSGVVIDFSSSYCGRSMSPAPFMVSVPLISALSQNLRRTMKSASCASRAPRAPKGAMAARASLRSCAANALA